MPSRSGRNLKTWRGQFRDADGILRSVSLCTNKEAARHMLHELETKAMRGRAGMIDPFEDHLKRPLAEHLADFKRHLKSKDNSTRYVNEITNQILTVMDGCKFRHIGDLSASRVMEWLADRRLAGMGITTSNHYLTAVKGFAHWLVKDRRASDNPFTHLSKLNANTDVRRERRHLTLEHFGQLIDAAGKGVPLYGLSGPDRAMLYLAAGYTGLRASELASLTPVSFDFLTTLSTVTVEAAYSKHRRKDILPLHPDLALRLREWLSESEQAKNDEKSILLPIDDASDAESKRLWPGMWAKNRHAAEMVRNDLQEAEICYEDDSGKVFDFHALRHQFISMLAQAGVHPKTAQELARHSTITLTMDHYTHVGLYDLNAALKSLPGLPDREASTMRATGTDDTKNVVAGVGDISCNSVRSIDNRPTSASKEGRNERPLQIQGFDSDCDSMKAVESNGAGGTRTLSQQIMSLHATPENHEENAHSRDSAAQGAAVGSENTPIDPDLQAVIERWAKLPEAIKAGILAMVKMTGDDAEG